MRVEIGVIFSDSPLTDTDALQKYRTHGGATEPGGQAKPVPRLEAFLNDLAGHYPRLESLPAEDRANSPWIGEIDVHAEQALIALGGSACADAVELVMELADKHGLVCFDPKTRSILTAPPGIHLEKQSGAAMWPLTLATLSLALVGVLWLH